MFITMDPRVASKFFELRRTAGPEVMAAIGRFLVGGTGFHGAAPLRPAPPVFIAGGAFTDRLALVRKGIAALEKRLAAGDDIGADLLRLERIEEALVCAAHAVGHDVVRRPSASPLAVLQIECGNSTSRADAADLLET